MGKGTRTRYAPKSVPTPNKGWKRSGQPCKVSRYSGLANGPIAGPAVYSVSINTDASWVGEYASLPAYGRFKILSATDLPTPRFTLEAPIPVPGGFAIDEPFDILIYHDGFAFDEVSYTTCAICGPNIAWRKKTLVRHQKTGQFVCPNCYDELGVNDLESERGYRSEAAGHLSEDFTAKSEWP